MTRVVDAQERDIGNRRLRLLEIRLAECYGGGFAVNAWQEYRDQLIASLEKTEAERDS